MGGEAARPLGSSAVCKALLSQVPSRTEWARGSEQGQWGAQNSPSRGFSRSVRVQHSRTRTTADMGNFQIGPLPAAVLGGAGVRRALTPRPGHLQNRQPRGAPM